MWNPILSRYLLWNPSPLWEQQVWQVRPDIHHIDPHNDGPVSIEAQKEVPQYVEHMDLQMTNQ